MKLERLLMQEIISDKFTYLQNPMLGSNFKVGTCMHSKRMTRTGRIMK